MKNPSRDPEFKAQEVSSATECTGLLAAQIETDDQGEELADLEAIHPIDPIRQPIKGKEEEE